MNKAEAMEALGISKRTLEKYQGTDLLPVTYIKGKTGEQADFAPEDVERLREMRAREARGAKVVTSAGGARPASIATLASHADNEGDASRTTNTGSAGGAGGAGGVTTLARVTPQAPVGQGSAVEFADLLAESYEKAIKNSVADLRGKTSLSFSEAHIVTGVPERQLREAVKDNKLKAIKMGRALRIKTSDAIAYAESLFN